ncbi:MAG: hypothetical protein ABI867_29350 [Kofleriaceae bacterium]
MTSKPFLTIDCNLLDAVTGGFVVLGPTPAPIRPMPNMGGPKYSAQWWDIVRSRGLDK